MKSSDRSKIQQEVLDALEKDKLNQSKPDWRDKYPQRTTGGVINLENTADDSTLNRMIQLKSFDPTKQILGKPGSLYFDKANGKVKIFIDETTGWKNLAFEP